MTLNPRSVKKRASRITVVARSGGEMHKGNKLMTSMSIGEGFQCLGLTLPVSHSVLQSVYDAVLFSTLLLEALLLGVVADYHADQPAYIERLPGGLLALQVYFCAFFIVELGTRLFFALKTRSADRSQRCGFCGICRDPWLIIDGGLVTFQFIDLVLTIGAADSKGDSALRSVGFFGSIRFLRLFRILRLLRVVQFVGELRKVVYLILGSLWSFIWTALLLTLLIYSVAVFFTQIVSDSLRLHGPTGPGSPGHELHAHFGSTARSIYTLYKAISGGIDWQDVSDPMAQISPLLSVVFVLYTAFAVLVLLNLVTGVFVDSAMKLSHADKEAELLKKVRNAFTSADIDGSGYVTWQEFHARMDSEAMVEFFEALEISTDRAEDLFHLIDRSEDEKLSFEELVAGGMMLQGPAKAVDLAAFQKLLTQQVHDLAWQMRLLRQQLL